MTCTCDLPAKCLVTNSMQFNGKHGCWHCLQRGSTYCTEGGGNCHVYPFNAEDPSGPKRTTDSVKKDVVFVKDASLFLFTDHGNERRRREPRVRSARPSAARLLPVMAPNTKSKLEIKSNSSLDERLKKM